ncbi:IS3 family transposase [Fastidiosipila sanguinis]|uniref:IS3 family transposase n=1 Tax=Fastidiosipila sanguinis TaxID=236753 RepID=UPI000D03ECCB
MKRNLRKKVRSLAGRDGRGRIPAKAKTKVILELQVEFPKIQLKIWLSLAELPRSSYYEWKNKLDKPVDKDKEIVLAIVQVVKESSYRYGYRRVSMKLRKLGLVVNHKKVLRIMREQNLLSTKFKTRSRKYNSYRGKVGEVADNLVKRQFNTARPNELWLTDVTEFRLKNSEEKIYLSAILDTYNSEIISFSIDKHPTTAFTNKALDEALKRVKDVSELVIHSDQGFHYQHSSWVKRLETRGIKQSMSRKGNCLDNSPMENFFGIMKQEMFYGEDFKNLEQLIEVIIEYIKWYNEDRIKVKINGLSPVEYRLQSA